MCTVAVRIATAGAWQIRLVAVRDELYSRETVSPAAHWPERDPALLGPLDLQAGGTPLAVHRRRRAVAVLVNAPPHAPDTRMEWPVRNRGTLPLLAAAGEDITSSTVRDLPGFHLLMAVADTGPTRDAARFTAGLAETVDSQRIVDPTVELLSWDGVKLTHRRVEPGDHVLTPAGLDAAEHERSEGVRTALARVPREAPVDSSPWRAVASAGVVDDQDVPAGRYGTVGASAIALSSRNVRYAVCARPGQTAWVSVLPVEVSPRGGNATRSLRGHMQAKCNPVSTRPRRG